MKFHTVLSTVLHKATLQQAWPQVWRKVYETKDFIPNLTELTIHEKNDDQVLRTMAIGQLVIKQRIVKDQNSHTVYFHNIQGSTMQGLIYNKLYYNQRKQLILQFGSDACNKKGDLFPPAEMFIKTLQGTKQVIEKSI